MLVLTRKTRETIVINVPPSTETQRIELLVSSIKSAKVSLSFESSRSISIVRGEIEDREVEQ